MCCGTLRRGFGRTTFGQLCFGQFAQCPLRRGFGRGSGSGFGRGIGPNPFEPAKASLVLDGEDDGGGIEAALFGERDHLLVVEHAPFLGGIGGVGRKRSVCDLRVITLRPAGFVIVSRDRRLPKGRASMEPIVRTFHSYGRHGLLTS